jgi:hypothetical protein
MPENERIADTALNLVFNQAFVELFPVPNQLVADDICIDFMQPEIDLRGERKD